MLWWTLRQLRSENTEKRARAVDTLALSADPRAVSALVDAVSDWHSMVSAKAVEALKKKGPAVVDTLINALCSGSSLTRAAATQMLGEISDPRVKEPLLMAMCDEDPHVRTAAVESLAKIRDPDTFHPVLKALEDKEPEVQRAAAVALNVLADRHNVEPIIGALSHKSGNVREELAGLLGRLNDLRAVTPLIHQALLDEDRGAQMEAEAALDRLDPDWRNSNAARAVVPTVIKRLSSKDREKRDHAVSALASARDPRALGPLTKIATRDPDARTRMRASEAASEIDPNWRQSARARKAAALSARKADEAKHMSDEEMIDICRRLCAAYADDDRDSICELGPLAKTIGEELFRRGGIKEMQRLFRGLASRPGLRTLEMHWDGIGEWRG